VFGKKKKFDLDGDGKIESLREELQGVFSQFQKMHDKLDKVNGELEEVINAESANVAFEEAELEKLVKSAEARIAQAKRIAEKAADEITANANLQKKVKEFIR
jgi:peptidoglycan hydrolase CwlO-like protein